METQTFRTRARRRTNAVVCGQEAVEPSRAVRGWGRGRGGQRAEGLVSEQARTSAVERALRESMTYT